MTALCHAVTVTRELLASGAVLVVETDDDRYLGTVEVRDGTLVVRSGFRGHPVVLPAESVVRLYPADDLDL